MHTEARGMGPRSRNSNAASDRNLMLSTTWMCPPTQRPCMPPCYPALWIKVAVNVILPIPEPIYGDPMAQGLHLSPHLRIPLLDPCFDASLPFDIGGAVKPAT